jgi:hypothetical protein
MMGLSMSEVYLIVEKAFSLLSIPKWIIIFSDNMNTVDIFSSLRAKPSYNPILKSTVSLLLKHWINLRVIHIPGTDNVIVDALSQFQNSKAITIALA